MDRRGKIAPWTAPEPELRRAHDVRRLRFCQFCQAAGFGLPAWNGAHAHGYCIGAKFGSAALLGMPVAELMKVTVSEIQALGLLKVFMANLDRAKKREAEAPRTSPEAIRLRKAAQSFAALKPGHDDFDRAGQRADRELRAAAVSYARLLTTPAIPQSVPTGLVCGHPFADGSFCNQPADDDHGHPHIPQSGDEKEGTDG